MTEVSFIIPSYNSYKTIPLTVDSICRQRSFYCVREIIIVDSSDDGQTRDVVKGYTSQKIKTVLLRQKTPPGKARNIGASIARSELLCFVDSDVVLHKNWLCGIINSFDTGRLAGSGSISLPLTQMNNRIAYAQLYLEFNEYLDTGSNRTISLIPACNMFVQKKLFEKAGRFPEGVTAEDVVISLNIRRLTPVWFLPQAKCFHIFRESIRSYCSNQLLIGKRNIVHRREVYSHWFYKGLWPSLLLPAFLLVKIARINQRVYRAGWTHYRNYLSSFHLFTPGLFCWAIGFLRASTIQSKRSTGSMRNQVDIGNVKVNNLTREEVLREVERLVRLNIPCYITPVNVDIIMRYNNDAEYARFYDLGKFCIADGMPIIWAARFLGTPIKQKISGSDMVVAICDLANRRGFRVFFMGGRPGAALGAKHRLKQRFKALLVDTYCPPYDFEKYPMELQKIVRLIRTVKPDILFVGLGSPKREEFIKEYHQQLGVPVSMGVGGAFEWIGGMQRRAPLWMQNMGLEWFWRLALEPRRLWKRYLIDNLPYFWLIYKQRKRSSKLQGISGSKRVSCVLVLWSLLYF